jgi:hypothetical protein
VTLRHDNLEFARRFSLVYGSWPLDAFCLLDLQNIFRASVVDFIVLLPFFTCILPYFTLFYSLFLHEIFCKPQQLHFLSPSRFLTSSCISRVPSTVNRLLPMEPRWLVVLSPVLVVLPTSVCPSSTASRRFVALLILKIAPFPFTFSQITIVGFEIWPLESSANHAARKFVFERHPDYESALCSRLRIRLELPLALSMFPLPPPLPPSSRLSRPRSSSSLPSLRVSPSKIWFALSTSSLDRTRPV